MDLYDFFQSFGFPTVSVVAVFWYLTKVQDDYRKDSKEQNERLTAHLDNVMTTNNALLDANATLIRDINVKLDLLTKNK